MITFVTMDHSAILVWNSFVIIHHELINITIDHRHR